MHIENKSNQGTLQAIILLLLWPSFNMMFSLLVLYKLEILDQYNTSNILTLIAKSWATFILAFLLIRIFEDLLFKNIPSRQHYLLRLSLHAVCILFSVILFYPLIRHPSTIYIPLVLPLLILLLEILFYVVIMYSFQKKEQLFQLTLSAKQAELQSIRAQTNPHFLFNTLNLISSEISHNPNNAKDIIYDLADLLRRTMSMSQEPLSSLENEIQVVTLYLQLQQKRFPERLQYTIDIPACYASWQVPSLFLLPVIENTIKHAVAPYAQATHIHIYCMENAKYFGFHIHDTGRHFNDKNIVYGTGFHILHHTLQAHYANHYDIALTSTETGGHMHIQLPINQIKSSTIKKYNEGIK